MTYQEKIYSEIYAVIKMLGEEYIEKLPNSEYSEIISNKSNKYNPIYTKDKPWKEQVEDLNAKIYLKISEYCYWSNEHKQDKIINKIMNDEELSDWARMKMWSNTFLEIKLKHIDILIELLEKNEYFLEILEGTDDKVKEKIFEKGIESLKDDDAILELGRLTNTDILVRNPDKISLLVEAYVNKGKSLPWNVKNAIRQIAEDKEKILDVMMKVNFESKREIFSIVLDDEHKEKILKELIEKCVDGKEAIAIWRCCRRSKIQENNLDIMYALIKEYPNLIEDLINATEKTVIIKNFEKMIEDDRIAIEVWGRTEVFKREAENIETFQEKNDMYFKKLLDKYPDRMSSILLKTEKDVQYRHKDFIVEKMKKIKDERVLYSSYYYLDNNIKKENIELFYFLLEKIPQNMCGEIWWTVRNDFKEKILQEKEFWTKYPEIFEKTIIKKEKPWFCWNQQPVEIQIKCKDVFLKIIEQYPNKILEMWKYSGKGFIIENIDLLFQTMILHKDQAMEFWECIPKSERKNYISRAIENNENNRLFLEKLWRKETPDNMNENMEEKIFSKLFPNDKDIKEKIEYLRKIEEFNDTAKEKVNLKILNEKVINQYSIFFIAQIVNYESIQKEFLEAIENPIKNKIMRYAFNGNENSIIVLNLLLSNFKKNSDLIEKIAEKDLKEESSIRSIVSFLMNTDTEETKEVFEIKTAGDIKNFNELKIRKCIECIENSDDSNAEYEYVRKQREMVLQVFFGISVDDAGTIKERYADNDISFLDKEMQEYLTQLNVFLNAENASKNVKDFYYKHKDEALKGSYRWSNMNKCKVQEKINKQYSEVYQETLYKLKDEDLLENQEFYYDKSGNAIKIKMYEIKDDFNMFVRSEGAYTYWEEPDDFLKAVNMPSIDYHGNCESFIGQDSISIAKPKGPIYGYFNSSGMLLQAPYDIGSNEANTSFDVVNERTGLPAKFLKPQQMIDSTRHGHNEFVFERLAYNRKTDKLEKRKPNCIIWIEEGEEKSNNERWKMTKKAAAQIGVPIVIINRERFLAKEEQKIAEMLNDFLNLKEDEEKSVPVEKILSKIITKFENNFTGNLFAKTDLKEKYFTPEQRENILNEIDAKIEDLKKEDLNKYYKCIKEMKEIAVSEIKKHSNAGDTPWFAWTEIMSKYERKIEEYENTLKIANLHNSYKEKEITLEEFNTITASMKKEQKSQEKSEVEIDGD